MGFRPLALGKANNGVWVVASETCAFELIGAEFVRDIQPGEMVIIKQSGLESVFPFATQPAHRCVFEWIYFARPDSSIDGRSVYRARERMGRRLAIEHPVDADVVIPVPDSGMAAAIGYARESGIPYDQGLMRSHYMGRTFIEPSQQIRHFGVKLKLSPVREVLRGNRVVVVDDSIVRGTTSRKIVGMIRAAGAREVHLRISSPPTVGPCRYGIDTPTREELIGSSHSVDQIRDFVGADSLGYLSLEGLYQSVDGDWGGKEAGATDGRPKGVVLPVIQSDGPGPAGYCDACFSGRYPIAAEQPARLRQLRLISA
jgi:amidophosphoribosyltransferase